MEWSNIAAIDLVVIIPLLIAIWRGFRKGFIVKIASLIALIAGVYAGFHGADGLADWLYQEFDWPESVLSLTAFILAFILVVIGVHLLAKMIEKIIDLSALGFINKLGGLAFGFVQMLFILSTLSFAFDEMFGQREWLPEGTYEEAIIYPHVESAIEIIIPEMKRGTPWEEIKETIKTGMENVESSIQEGIEKLDETED